MIPQLNNKNETRKADINFTVCYPVPAAQRFALPALGRGRRRRPTRKADINFTVCYPVPAAQRFALPALGRGRRSRPTRKRLRRRKLLEMCAESPASGARFVRRAF